MSGKRLEILANGEIYHVFNKAIANEQIFIKSRLLKHAVDLIEYYRFPQRLRFSFFRRLPEKQKLEYSSSYHNNNSKLVDIYAFCLMPNHFHLLVKQASHNGIKTFLSNFQNSFGKYFNTITTRSGSVFQKPFKARRVSSDEEFLHLGRYIHLNPVTSFLTDFKNLGSYPWSSYPTYIKDSTSKNELVDPSPTLSLTGSRKKYIKFVENQVDYQRKLQLIKHLTIE